MYTVLSKKVHYSAFYSQVESLSKIIRAFTQHWLYFTSNTPLRKAETLRTEKSEKNQTSVNMYLGIWRYYYCAICILNCLQSLSEKIIKVMMQFTIAKIWWKTHLRVNSKLLEKQILQINSVYQVPSSDRRLSTPSLILYSTENSTWLQNLHCSSYHSDLHESQIFSTTQKHSSIYSWNGSVSHVWCFHSEPAQTIGLLHYYVKNIHMQRQGNKCFFFLCPRQLTRDRKQSLLPQQAISFLDINKMGQTVTEIHPATIGPFRIS